MFDQTFSYKNFATNVIKKIDYKKNPTLKIPAIKKGFIDKAIIRAKNGFDVATPVIKNTYRGKETYKLKDFSDELTLRKATENIRVVAKVKAADRNEVISTLICFLKENVEYRIYRLDIRSFYESVSKRKVIEDLKANAVFSRTTIKLISSLLDVLGASGLPRGISASAILSELYLQNFDRKVEEDEDVFFFCRYCDDIVVITSAEENKTEFKKKMSFFLGEGLSFNNKKTNIMDVKDFSSTYRVNYLGYEISVSGGGENRERMISIDISENKIKKIKSKVFKAFLAFCKNGDFELFKMRMKILTANYWIFDPRTGFVRKAGIYYNYKFLNPETSKALPNLDEFLKNFICKISDSIGRRKGRSLTADQKGQLLKFSFENGFKRKVFYHYNRKQLMKIHRCWQYE